MTRRFAVGVALGAVAGMAVGAAAVFTFAGAWPRQAVKPATSAATMVAFIPPRAADAPADAYGDAIRLGERLLTDTAAMAPQHVGNGLACRNCHLDAGRKAGAAPLWAAFVNYPAFRQKNGEIDSFQKRVQDCFLYSMNGKPPALGSRELLAIESYAAYMARGLPSGISPSGRGFPAIAAAGLPGDDVRGARVYAASCSVCHGAAGEGQVIDGKVVYPPLWGAKSYNWGAGMATIDKGAAFIHANMPLGQERSLSVQQAWDVATFIDGKVRPQDPRYVESALATRARHHNSPFSRYGTIVDGRRLGDQGYASDVHP